MESNKVYFNELIERVKSGEFRKVVELKDYNGCQVKFGDGVMMTVNLDTGRAVINLFDNSEVDVEELYATIKASQLVKAETRVAKAKERLAQVQAFSTPNPKKSLLQRLFKS